MLQRDGLTGVAGFEGLLAAGGMIATTCQGMSVKHQMLGVRARKCCNPRDSLAVLVVKEERGCANILAVGRHCPGVAESSEVLGRVEAERSDNPERADMAPVDPQARPDIQRLRNSAASRNDQCCGQCPATP